MALVVDDVPVDVLAPVVVLAPVIVSAPAVDESLIFVLAPVVV